MDWRHQIVGTDAASGLQWQLEIACPDSITLLLTLSGAWVLTANLPALDTIATTISTFVLT